MGAFAALLTLEILDYPNVVFLVALRNFHKAQCYFSSAVQIAALILLSGTWRNTSTLLTSNDYSDAHEKYFDTSAVIVLATSGFVPVTFGLATLTRFGSPSWHLIMLSFITFGLATTTLSIFYHYDHRFGKLDDYYSLVQNDGYLDYGTCVIGGHVGDALFPLCGSSLLNSNAISSSTITKWWFWVTWTNCMAWMLLCSYTGLMGGIKIPEMVRSRLESASERYYWMKLSEKVMVRLKLRLFSVIVTPALCFGVQYYLIIVFIRHYLVSGVWTFGQIIAATVWVPTLFDFYHDIISKCNLACTHCFEG